VNALKGLSGVLNGRIGELILIPIWNGLGPMALDFQKERGQASEQEKLFS
jgi:hypothetical protein